MAYNVIYYGREHLNQIQDVWRILQTGEEMTLFQSYQWFQMLSDCYVPMDTREFESIYAVVKLDNTPCMIAPLWIVKKTFRILNTKGAYLLGRRSFSDYLNFVYQHFDGSAFDYLLNDLSKKYGIKYFTFENFRESTSAYVYIVKNYKICRNSEYPSVGLNLPSSIDGYHKMLSKNSRQNLRTANNRLKKDGRSLVFNFDDQQVDKELCLKIRESKLVAKSAHFSLYFKYKYRILNSLRYRFHGFIPIMHYPESKLMTAYDNQGKLRAFFNYAYDPDDTRIRVMAAGTDLDFARYSPGMLLMYNFIMNAIEEGVLKEVDLTRGDEKYKFSLGGKLSKYHTIKVRMKKQSPFMMPPMNDNEINT